MQEALRRRLVRPHGATVAPRGFLPYDARHMRERAGLKSGGK
jgi:hypothetical protein